MMGLIGRRQERAIWTALKHPRSTVAPVESGCRGPGCALTSGLDVITTAHSSRFVSTAAGDPSHSSTRVRGRVLNAAWMTMFRKTLRVLS